MTILLSRIVPRRPVPPLGLRRRHVEAQLQLLRPRLALRSELRGRVASEPLPPLRGARRAHRAYALSVSRPAACADGRAGRAGPPVEDGHSRQPKPRSRRASYLTSAACRSPPGAGRACRGRVRRGAGGERHASGFSQAPVPDRHPLERSGSSNRSTRTGARHARWDRRRLLPQTVRTGRDAERARASPPAGHDLGPARVRQVPDRPTGRLARQANLRGRPGAAPGPRGPHGHSLARRARAHALGAAVVPPTVG